MRLLFILLLAVGVAAQTQAGSAAPAVADPAAGFITWARQQAVALPTCDDSSAFILLRATASLVGHRTRVIALGEPAHGAQEPLAFRNCLFRDLVENHGFTAIAIESGLSESRRLRDYVAGGAGDARQLARESLTWGFGRLAENVALIDWVHDYNANPEHERKVHFYGIDMSGGDRSGEWRNARITLDASLAYLERAAAERSKPVRTRVEPFLDRFTQSSYTGLTAGPRAALRAAIAGLIRFFDRERTQLVAATGPEEYDWARRNAVLAGQAQALFSVSRPPATDDALQPEDYRSDAVRDAAMADNVRWVLEREGAAGRVLLFAHDGHVVNAPTRGGIWSVYSHAPMTMGQHLRIALGDALLILPISSATNGPGLPPGPPHAGTLDIALAATGVERFLLDIRTRKTSLSRDWLDQSQTMRVNFDSELLLTPRTAFDGVIFIAVLTPAAKAP